MIDPGDIRVSKGLVSRLIYLTIEVASAQPTEGEESAQSVRIYLLFASLHDESLLSLFMKLHILGRCPDELVENTTSLSYGMLLSIFVLPPRTVYLRRNKERKNLWNTLNHHPSRTWPWFAHTCIANLVMVKAGPSSCWKGISRPNSLKIQFLSSAPIIESNLSSLSARNSP